MSKCFFFCISDSCKCESLHSKCPSHTLSECTLTWCPGPIFHVSSYFARCRCDIDLRGVLVSIFIPFKCPHFYVQSHSFKLALKHLFGVKEAVIRSKFCNLFFQTLVSDYVILTLFCLIFQCAQKRSKLLNFEKFFLQDCFLYQEVMIMTKISSVHFWIFY